MGNKSLGRAIAYYRKLNGLTQNELGEKLGMTGKAVGAWESGRNEPTIGVIEQMAMIFNCQKSDLIGGELKMSDEAKEIAELIKAYSESDETTREMVWRILGRK